MPLAIVHDHSAYVKYVTYAVEGSAVATELFRGR